MRYKEFNPNAVLEKSISLFWQKGFNGGTINDLVKITGVNRFSLYHEFENKAGILYASLALYREKYCEEKFSILESDGDLNQILMRFFMAYLEYEQPVAGCYFIHTGTELADSDARINSIVNDYLNEIQTSFKVLLISKGCESNADLYAKHLLGLYCTAMSFCLIHTPE